MGEPIPGQLAFFEDFTDERILVEARLADMHRFYGVAEGHICGDCALLERQSYNDKTYLKCSRTNITRGPGSDWRAKWQACGLWRRG